MTKCIKLCAALWLTSACAPEEAYLVVDVSFPEDAQGMFGLITVKRNSGPAIIDEPDGPFAITQEHLGRRIAVHAEGSELGAELELALLLCSSRELNSCDQTSIMDLQNVFRAGHTTALCFTFDELARGLLPEKIDIAAAEDFPDGLRLCEDP